VELIAGIGFLLIYLSYDNHLAKLLLAVLLLMYLTVFFIDLKHFIIPDALNYGIIIIAFLKNFLPPLDLTFMQDLTRSLIGGIAGFASIWIIIYLYKTFKKTEGMGMGDAKLMAGVGLLFGWQSIPFVLFLAAVLGLLIVMPSLMEKKKSLKSQVPFAPYIITAGVIYFLYGNVLYKMVSGI
jgi:leader peptidase (prepilin peptidase)/N-methyltransferase